MKIREEVKGEKFSISSDYKGDKCWGGEGNHKQPQNYHDHKVTISRPGHRVSFDFWGSIINPKIRTAAELRFAVYCFVSDAASGRMEFEEFCSEFGYDSDSIKAMNTWQACRKSTKKCDRMFSAKQQDVILAEWQ